MNNSKDHNYNLRELVRKVMEDEFPVKFYLNVDTVYEIMRAICVIHNSSTIQRGYGPLYPEEMNKIVSRYICENFFEMLGSF